MVKKLPLLAVAVLACGLSTTGCSSSIGKKLDSLAFTPTRYVTNTVPERVEQVKTNRAIVVTSTNATTGEVTSSTNREPVVLNITVPPHQEVVPVEWAPNQSTLGTANFVGGFAGPYGAMASTALGAALTIAASVRSRKYKEALVSTAQGVEHFVTAMDAQGQGNVSTALKNVLSQVHKDDGVQGMIQSVLTNNVSVVPVIKA
jgi:hypothetical protein